VLGDWPRPILEHVGERKADRLVVPEAARANPRIEHGRDQGEGARERRCLGRMGPRVDVFTAQHRLEPGQLGGGSHVGEDEQGNPRQREGIMLMEERDEPRRLGVIAGLRVLDHRGEHDPGVGRFERCTREQVERRRIGPV
jgi:hypothetical protein